MYTTESPRKKHPRWTSLPMCIRGQSRTSARSILATPAAVAAWSIAPPGLPPTPRNPSRKSSIGTSCGPSTACATNRRLPSRVSNSPTGRPRAWPCPSCPSPSSSMTPRSSILPRTTPVTTETAEQMKQRRDGYGHRWGSEVFHNVEKNGCSEEARRFEKARRMEACLAVLAVVAVRVYQLRLALEQTPQASAEEVATQEEQEVMARRLGIERRTLTVREFVFAVAK